MSHQQPFGNNRPNAPQGGGNVPFGGNAPLGGPQNTKGQQEKESNNTGLKIAGGFAAAALGAGAIALGTKLYKDHKEDEQKQQHQYQQVQQVQQLHHQQPQNFNPVQVQQQTGQQLPQQQQGHPQPLHHNNSQGNFQSRPLDDSRSSKNSPTPHAYPLLENNPGDNIIKYGTKIALKHNMTGRFLHAQHGYQTRSGTNQILVTANSWQTGPNDWWQVLPANGDVFPPGVGVKVGTQVRLRHVATKAHLHSHNFPSPISSQQEVSAFGGEMQSDENDHWVIECFGGSHHGSEWNSNQDVILKHYVTGKALHSHDILVQHDVQEVTCFGNGHEENDKWKIVLH